MNTIYKLYIKLKGSDNEIVHYNESNDGIMDVLKNFPKELIEEYEITVGVFNEL